LLLADRNVVAEVAYCIRRVVEQLMRRPALRADCWRLSIFTGRGFRVEINRAIELIRPLVEALALMPYWATMTMEQRMPGSN